VLVKNEFKKNAFVTDQSKLDNLKKNALQAVTNYVMHISGSKLGMSANIHTPEKEEK